MLSVAIIMISNLARLDSATIPIADSGLNQVISASQLRLYGAFTARWKVLAKLQKLRIFNNNDKKELNSFLELRSNFSLGKTHIKSKCC